MKIKAMVGTTRLAVFYMKASKSNVNFNCTTLEPIPSTSVLLERILKSSAVYMILNSRGCIFTICYLIHLVAALI